MNNRILTEIVLIFLISLNFLTISFAEGKSNFNNLDSVFIHWNSGVMSTKLIYSNYNDISLVDDEVFFSGYLVLKFSPVTYYTISKEALFKKDLIISAYWIDEIEEISTDSNHYIYFPNLWHLVSDGNLSYDNGERDKLSIFIHYLRMFNQRAWIRKSDGVSYLYMGSGIITADSIAKQSFLEKNDDENFYVIIKTSFDCAILEFKSQGYKILVPTSVLYEYVSINENSVVNTKNGFDKISNLGFKKSNSIIKVVLQ